MTQRMITILYLSMCDTSCMIEHQEWLPCPACLERDHPVVSHILEGVFECILETTLNPSSNEFLVHIHESSCCQQLEKTKAVCELDNIPHASNLAAIMKQTYDLKASRSSPCRGIQTPTSIPKAYLPQLRRNFHNVAAGRGRLQGVSHVDPSLRGEPAAASFDLDLVPYVWLVHRLRLCQQLKGLVQLQMWNDLRTEDLGLNRSFSTSWLSWTHVAFEPSEWTANLPFGTCWGKRYYLVSSKHVGFGNVA